MMSEMSLRRIEQFLFGVARELRPTLAKCDPTVFVRACPHVTLAWLHLVPPAESVSL
jgi:hypothetical protein